MKVYRVNAKNRKIVSEELKKEYALFGGRGLIAKIMNDEVNPACDPLSYENKLIVCTGLFAGTTLTTANRLSVGGKSPLTGGIKEANMGGNAGNYLAGHGIKAFIFEGKPEDEEWSLIRIDSEGRVEMAAANEYAGCNNYDFVAKMHQKYGKDTAVLSIGAAGEIGLKTASIQGTEAHTGHPCRAAARGGLGTVMGSKKIKAIVIEKPKVRKEVQYFDKQKFQETSKKVVEAILENPSLQGMTKVGTIASIEATGPMAILPVHNFSALQIEREDFEKVNAGAFVKTLYERGGKNGLPCQPGCVVKCSNIYNSSEGEYVTAGLEYETIALNGPNCDIHDLDYVAQVDRLCDDIGVDTMDLGASIALCMETEQIAWGDKDAAFDLIKEIYAQTELGKLIGNGTEAVGKAFGAKRIPTVKGQAIAGYDPRNLKGTGVTYATSAMGADHTCGITIGNQMDHTKKDGQIQASINAQFGMALCDNIMCVMAFGGAMASPDFIPGLMHGMFGGEWDIQKVMGIGYQTLALERAFNKAAGFTGESDRLPDFFYTEPSPVTGAVFDISTEEMEAALAASGL